MYMYSFSLSPFLLSQTPFTTQFSAGWIFLQKGLFLMVKPNRKKRKEKFLFTLQPNPTPFPGATIWCGLLIFIL